MIREYRDSDALLAKLGGLFAEGFDDCLCQVKASHRDLDLSDINIDAQAQTSIQSVHSKTTDELFANDCPGDVEDGKVEENPCHFDVQKKE